MKRQKNLFFIVHAAIILFSSNYLFSAAAADAQVGPEQEDGSQYDYHNYFRSEPNIIRIIDDSITRYNNLTLQEINQPGFITPVIGAMILKYFLLKHRDPIGITIALEEKPEPIFVHAHAIWELILSIEDPIAIKIAQIIDLPLSEPQSIELKLYENKKLSFSEEKKLIETYPWILLHYLRKSRFSYRAFSKNMDPIYLDLAREMLLPEHFNGEEHYELMSYLYISYMYNTLDLEKKDVSIQKIKMLLSKSSIFLGWDLQAAAHWAEQCRFYIYQSIMNLDDIDLIKWLLYHPQNNEMQFRDDTIETYKNYSFTPTPNLKYFEKIFTFHGKTEAILDLFFKNTRALMSPSTLFFEYEFFEYKEENLGTFFKLLNAIENYSLDHKKSSKKELIADVKEARAFLETCNYFLLHSLEELLKPIEQRYVNHSKFFKKADWSTDAKYQEKLKEAGIERFSSKATELKESFDTCDCAFLQKNIRDKMVDLFFEGNQEQPFLNNVYLDRSNPSPLLGKIITKNFALLLLKKIECCGLKNRFSEFNENEQLVAVYSKYTKLIQSPYEFKNRNELIQECCDVYFQLFEFLSKENKKDLRFVCCDKEVVLPRKPNGVFEPAPEKDIYIGAKRTPSPRKSPGRTSTSPAAAAAATAKKEDVELIKVSHPEPEQPAAAANRIEVEKVIEKRFVCRNFAPRVKNWFTNPNDQEVKDDYQRTEKNGGTKQNKGRRAIWKKALKSWAGDQNIAWESIARHHAVPLCLMSLLEDPTMELGVINDKEDLIKIKVSGSCYTDDDLLREDGKLEITIDSKGICFHWFFRVTEQWKDGLFERMVFRASPPDQKAIAHALQNSEPWQIEGMKEFGQFNISNETRSVKVWIEGSGFYYIFNQNDKGKKTR